MSEQTTPRTVEEADALAHLRWLVEQGHGWADHRTHMSFMVVRDALLQAAWMPSVDEVAAAVALAQNVPFVGPKQRRIAEQVVALWGGGER